MIELESVDLTAVLAEVKAAFLAYEDALLANDVTVLDDWFWADERLVRFGIAEIQYGAAAVARWRKTAGGVSADRLHRHITVTAWGADTAVVSLEFTNGQEAPRGRQSQVWARFVDGWRIVHAHVSMIPAV